MCLYSWVCGSSETDGQVGSFAEISTFPGGRLVQFRYVESRYLETLDSYHLQRCHTDSNNGGE